METKTGETPILDEIDRLKLENLWLRREALERQQSGLNHEVRMMADHIAKKYDIDLSAFTVDTKTGALSPKGSLNGNPTHNAS